MPNRREVYRLGALALGNLFGLALAVPGLKYLLDPLGRRSGSGDIQAITRLGQLAVGQPQAFSIIAGRLDAWVQYPREAVGTVWLVRQPDDSVLALSAECPHLSCPVSLAARGKSFLCPCHSASFALDGTRTNPVAARGMDRLEVELSADPDPEIRVKFERFQPQSAEKKPLA
jgi:menaquinol-cytochrome c reductase iron-sulfur subunit